MASFRSLCGVGAIALVTAIGCGDAPNTTSVSGQVTLSGESMPSGGISFFPAGGGRPVAGAVDDSGQYDLRLPPGDYTVVLQISTVLPDGWKEGDPIPPQPAKIPRQYTLPKTSPLKMSVASGEDLQRDFDLN